MQTNTDFLNKVKQQILRISPAFLVTFVTIRLEIWKLNKVSRLVCNTSTLRPMSAVDINEMFDRCDVQMKWNDIKKRIDGFSIPDGAGGVNPGDRKAIFCLVSKLRPSSVLEVGTHIGASTLHIASALFTGQVTDGNQGTLVSVDIADVNDPISRPWLRYGVKSSPIEMIGELGFGAFVEFVQDTSLRYLARCEHRFDVIFLDGDHTAATVYQEIPSVLDLLNEDGLILLHDYFPNLNPLWSNGSVIPGPFLATERLKNEGLNIVVLPLGELPWPTKLQSRISSLALVLRNT